VQRSDESIFASTQQNTGSPGEPTGVYAHSSADFKYNSNAQHVYRAPATAFTPKHFSELDNLPLFDHEESVSPAALSVWKRRIAAVQATIPSFPEGQWSGRGIAMSAGGRMYFTSAYVSIRVLRERLGCTLPIEVFYSGAEELPPEAIEHIQREYNVSFVDLSKVSALRGVSMKGYAIKALAVYLSSFEHVLWMDSDNIALEDPTTLFESAEFAVSGALLWPDYCNMISQRRETFHVFGLTAPHNQPQPRDGKQTVWPPVCFDGVSTEVETGQVLVNKRRAFGALYMLMFINLNHRFFLRRLFHGDKMTFHYAWLAAGTPYHFVRYAPYSVGLARPAAASEDQLVFCGNTMAQRHPSDGRIVFLHRTSAKYKDASGYFLTPSPARAWTHIAKQHARASWNLVYRGELPDPLFVGSEAAMHSECVAPTDPDVKIRLVKNIITETEDDCLTYLAQLRDQPFYPGYRVCSQANLFFCRHP
jgi:hypothetical protein